MNCTLSNKILIALPDHFLSFLPLFIVIVIYGPSAFIPPFLEDFNFCFTVTFSKTSVLICVLLTHFSINFSSYDPGFYSTSATYTHGHNLDLVITEILLHNLNFRNPILTITSCLSSLFPPVPNFNNSET